jgi:4-amino-4-deoxy-L-arabinose transferase-like glycosyltransferase
MSASPVADLNTPPASGGRTAHLAAPPRGVYAGVVLLVLAVLAAGLILPDLMGNDAPQDAGMAMRMHQQGDWVNLVKNGHDYLDKPHLLFWSAMVGYRLFGVHDWSYRILSVLASLLGAWSVSRLGTRLYGDPAGKIAAVMFLTAYAIMLGNHDVRMDALLTGFTAFGVWQLVTWLETGAWRPLVLGAAGVGLAFSAKGMVAVAATGACLFFFVWGRRLWRRLASWQAAAGVAVFLLAISPVVICYWLQFDLHPEKVIGGRTGVSGVRFILLGQGVDRFGGGKGEASAGDPLFFFHSLLWAFLPWSALLFVAGFHRVRDLIRGRWRAFHEGEQLTLPGVFLLLVILGFSRFKLPHYLNVFFPMLAVLTAGWLVEAWRRERWTRLRWLWVVQGGIAALLMVLTAVVALWAFPLPAPWVTVAALGMAALAALGLRLRDPLQRVWVPPALAILLLFFVFHASVYPELGRHQAGRHLAARALALGVDWERTYFLDRIHQPFQFYAGRILPQVDLPRVRRELSDGRPVFLVVGEHGRRQLGESGLEHASLAESAACRLTKLTWSMIDPRTRGRDCPRAYLMRLEPPLEPQPHG